jgi:hypothetical protein
MPSHNRRSQYPKPKRRSVLLRKVKVVHAYTATKQQYYDEIFVVELRAFEQMFGFGLMSFSQLAREDQVLHS